jgi:FMN phosphatase YigB (HAD superfamily)
MSKRAFLVDVGGTLVPDDLPDAPGVRDVRLARLAALLPELEAGQVAELLDRLREGAGQGRDQLVQRTDAMIAGELARFRPAADLAVRAGQVCRAMGRPTGHEHPPFPGHDDLLRTAGELGLRRVLVTNTAWVSDEDWLAWWIAARGLTGLVDGVVTSYSAGRRKPDRAMFDNALRIAGCPAAEAIFIGDKEAKDIEPALALGMTTIRVAIQKPPSPTRADRLVTSMAEAAEALRTLAA